MSAPVPPGRHSNWCGCRQCRAQIAEFESRQWRGIRIAATVLIGVSGVLWVIAKAIGGIAGTWHEW